MLAIPAIDLRDAHCVQLVGGDYARETVRLDDPVRVARRWTDAGFSRLHVVDLDAATGRGENRAVVRELLRHADVPVQVGGGVRDDEIIASLLAEGADRVVVGTRGINDPAWLAAQAARAPGRIILAADIRDRFVVTAGWTASTRLRLRDVICDLKDTALSGLLVTAVHKEGLMHGADLPLMEEVASESPWPVIASGGVGTMQDLRDLENRGISAVVIGMALYTDALDPRVVAEEFTG